MRMAHRVMMMGVSVTPPSVLELSELLDTGISVAAGTDVGLDASIAVSTGDYLVCWFGSRHGTSRTHNSITPSGFSGTFTKSVVDEEIYDTVSAGHTRLSCWTCTVSSGGTGNITGVTASDTFQRGLILLRVPAGASIAQTAAGGNETGTGNSIAWNATPNAAGLSIGCGIYQGNPSPSLASHASITGALIDSNTNFLMNAWQKLLSPPDPLVFSGALNNRGRALGAVNIIEA